MSAAKYQPHAEWRILLLGEGGLEVALCANEDEAWEFARWEVEHGEWLELAVDRATYSREFHYAAADTSPAETSATVLLERKAA